ncbi:MAG: kinetoplast-associated-like protein, partial [Actinomycetota bacterium]|nr:kinetoplast-associated-like protein [Actinomycetota bacterium]
SEAGARNLRAMVADEVVAMRSSAAEALRRSREEAAQLLTEAQAEADRRRSQARQVLTDARAEVDALRRRRDDIATELTQMSGVIEALAVPESTQENEEQT